VVARFLERLLENDGPMRKTELQMAVRLNYSIFRRYVDWMERKGLLSTGECIELTPKGLETYGTLVTWIRETVGEEHI